MKTRENSVIFSGKEDSLEVYTPEQSYFVEAGTKTEKKDWLQKLRTRIAMALHGTEATDKDEIGMFVQGNGCLLDP